MTRSEIKPDAELDEPLRFERLLAEISTFFINLPADRIDGEIEVAQRRVCEFLDLDRSSLFQVSFGVGVVVGAAWGYAWGGCNWRGGDVDIDINRSTNINNNIDRSKYQNKVTTGQGGRGEWKHDPEHREGVSYRDQGTAQKFDRGASRDAQSREAFRGRADAGKQDLARGDADQFRDRSGGGSPGSQDRPNAGSMDRSKARQRQNSCGIERPSSTQRTDKSAFGSMIEVARQGNPAAGGIRVCHLRDPAVAVCREVVVAVVAAAADAAEDSRPGTTQSILIGGNIHDATDQ